MNLQERKKELASMLRTSPYKKRSEVEKVLNALGLKIVEIEPNYEIHPHPEVFIRAEMVGKDEI